MANNYNMSSSGYNVQFTASYDTDLSSMYFNENFVIDKQEWSLCYTGCDYSADNFIITVKETDANRALLMDPHDDTPELFFDDLISDFNYDNGLKSIHDKLSEYTRAGLDYDCNFVVMISSGYSQGDRRAVYILKDQAEYVTRDYIDNLLWDAPIYARVEINGGEVLREDEILGDDFYQWDADAVLNRIETALIKQNYSADCIAEVTSLIPKTLDYN